MADSNHSGSFLPFDKPQAGSSAAKKLTINIGKNPIAAPSQPESQHQHQPQQSQPQYSQQQYNNNNGQYHQAQDVPAYSASADQSQQYAAAGQEYPAYYYNQSGSQAYPAGDAANYSHYYSADGTYVGQDQASYDPNAQYYGYYEGYDYSAIPADGTAVDYSQYQYQEYQQQQESQQPQQQPPQNQTQQQQSQSQSQSQSSKSHKSEEKPKRAPAQDSKDEEPQEVKSHPFALSEKQLSSMQKANLKSAKPKKGLSQQMKKPVQLEQHPRFFRKAGGFSWEDKTLADWDQNDYRIFVGDLGNEVTDELLEKAFSKYISFQRCKVLRDKKTMKTKGFGFVSFSDPLDFSRAMKEMNGKYLGNRPCKLFKSRWKDIEDVDRTGEGAKKKKSNKPKPVRKDRMSDQYAEMYGSNSFF